MLKLARPAVLLADYSVVISKFHTGRGTISRTMESGTTLVYYSTIEKVETKLAEITTLEQIKTLYIEPGSPWEQAYIKRFHDKLRDECLNRKIFRSLAEARIILEEWRVEYNEQRPHSALGYLTPVEFAAARQAEKWEVVSNDLNNPDGLFTTGPARAGPLLGSGLAGSS